MALVLALGLAHVLALRFFYDDAFITFRYAANLAHGHGPVFNPGDASRATRTSCGRSCWRW